LERQRGLAEMGQGVGFQWVAAFGKAFRGVLGTTPGGGGRAWRGV
ncbi:AraC family transcriptional regulator, partial [Burkholderia multivorans]